MTHPGAQNPLPGAKPDTPLVGVVMGSSSDWEVMQPAVAMLKQFGVPFELLG